MKLAPDLPVAKIEGAQATTQSLAARDVVEIKKSRCKMPDRYFLNSPPPPVSNVIKYVTTLLGHMRLLRFAGYSFPKQLTYLATPPANPSRKGKSLPRDA